MAKSNKEVFLGTGRRKSSIARVRLTEGKGKITINGKDIEEYFGKQVYLDLFVKVIPKWRDKEKFLNMIGYKDFLNK